MRKSLSGLALYGRKTYTGFTIVELLIVIVVIAILAAIAAVTYNGMQARAKYAQQVSKLDELGRAIQLWKAENGGSLKGSGSGYQGDGYGGFYATNTANSNYTSTSIYAMLAATGYLPHLKEEDGWAIGIANILLSPCTNLNDSRWVVVAKLNPAPAISVEDQVNQTGCTNSLITLYTDRDPDHPNTYGGNFVKVY